jgi:hypothetical protein
MGLIGASCLGLPEFTGNLSLDLTAISDLRIAGIETIDFTGSASNSLTLILSDAIALSAPANQPIVEGAAGSPVFLRNRVSDSMFRVIGGHLSQKPGFWLSAWQAKKPGF